MTPYKELTGEKKEKFKKWLKQFQKENDRSPTIEEVYDDVIPLNEIGKIETVKVYNQAYVDKQQKRIADLEEKLANADYQLEGRDNEIAELKEEIRQLKNEVEDLRGYCNQIGKVKTDVLKAFEHIVAK